ncbi:DUF6092 family protein [Streptomyces sp. HNM0574]|uniref:DUF6092 family protein n=1 Tax=Streptomyces sp. HNM0574 TaxID=2714954 RepID=UPI001F0DCB64|nr:DUF6092 family protein [Streptomyces sp. HNM0574]
MTSGPNRPEANPELAREALLLAAFLLSSGRGLLDEPPAYGPARCADGARRALELLALCGPPDPRLTHVRERLEDALCGPMADVDLPELLRSTCGQVLDVVAETAESSTRPAAPG